MKIALHTYSDITGSLHIMAQDLKREYLAMGHDCIVVTSIEPLVEWKPQLLLNFGPRHMISIHREVRRYFECENLANVFTMSCETFTTAMIAGYLAVGMNVPLITISPAINRDLTQRSRDIFNMACLRKIVDNMVQINYGVLDIYKSTKKTDLDAFIAPFTRTSHDKRFENHQLTTRRTMALFHLHKYKPHTTVYTAGAFLSRVDSANLDGYTRKDLITDRSVYAEELQKYAFAICVCHFESFGLYYLELMLSGVIVVFEDYPWVRELLPDYKYVCAMDDIPALMLHIRQNYDEAFAYMEKTVIPYIRERYMLRGFAEKVLKHFEGKRYVIQRGEKVTH